MGDLAAIAIAVAGFGVLVVALRLIGRIT